MGPRMVGVLLWRGREPGGVGDLLLVVLAAALVSQGLAEPTPLGLGLAPVTQTALGVGGGGAPAEGGCSNFTTCGECRGGHFPCTWCPSRQSCLGQDMIGICNDPALMCPVEDDKDTGKETRCSGAVDCASCMRLGGVCGWCPTASRCQLQGDVCDKGWSNTTCYAVCPSDKTPFHDTAGVVQLGAQIPRSVSYLPGETCVFTIWPLLDASGSRRSTLIRLQFEYVDLGPGDHIDIFSNTVEGPKLLSVGGAGESAVNRIITSRSTAVVVRFTSEGSKGGTGFRLYYRVIQGSPLDIYLISAIIVTSILTCVLCSCCCNNCVAVIADHSARLTGAAPSRALSPEEKARLPTSQYSSTDKHTYDSKECCICLSDFEVGEPVRELPCEHLFHPPCIDTWLELNTLCPLCKKDVRENRPDGTGIMAVAARTRLARFRRSMPFSMTAWIRGQRGAEAAAAAAAPPGNGPRQQQYSRQASSEPLPVQEAGSQGAAVAAAGESTTHMGIVQFHEYGGTAGEGSSTSSSAVGTGVGGAGDVELGVWQQQPPPMVAATLLRYVSSSSGGSRRAPGDEEVKEERPG